MNPNDLQAIKQRLLDQLDAVSTEIENHADSSALATSEVEASIVRSDDQLVRKITLALQRIEDGSYGRCSECKEEIAAARLEAKPSVSLCTPCQEKKEQEQRQAAR